MSVLSTIGRGIGKGLGAVLKPVGKIIPEPVKDWARSQIVELVIKKAIESMAKRGEQENMGGVKPGYKTTEFWLTLCAWVVAALMNSGAFGQTSELFNLLSIVAAALNNAGYNVSRGLAKSKQ